MKVKCASAKEYSGRHLPLFKLYLSIFRHGKYTQVLYFENFLFAFFSNWTVRPEYITSSHVIVYLIFNSKSRHKLLDIKCFAVARVVIIPNV